MPRLNLNCLIVILSVVTVLAGLNFLLDLFLEEKARWFEELTAERNLEVELSERDELKAALKDKSDAEKFFTLNVGKVLVMNLNETLHYLPHDDFC